MEQNVPNSNESSKTVTDTAAFLPDQAASEVVILNNTGKTVNVTQWNDSGSGPVAGGTYACADGTFYIVDGIVNANQVKVANGTDTASISVPFRFYN